ncbi:hypothetical protein [Haloarcula rara]|nr:hypothetical protein [Halomicroarcula sp. SHR3]
MTDGTDDTGSISGVLVYAAFLLGSVFVGPLETVLGLAVYWLVGTKR